MRIIGCDLHARQQTLAMLDTTTGEVVEVTPATRRRQRARALFFAATPGACRHRSHGIDGSVCKPDGGTGNRMPGRSSGDDSGCRAPKQKHDRRDAELILEAVGGKSLSNDLDAYEGTPRPAGPCCGTAISGYGCGRESKMRCSRLPWRMVYDEVPPCGARTDKAGSAAAAAGAPYGLSAECP